MTWRKSSYSTYNQNCIETDTWMTSSYSTGNGACLEWAKSSFSFSNGNCVEVRGARVRDSQLRDGAGNNVSPVLEFTAEAWREFTGRIKQS